MPSFKFLVSDKFDQGGLDVLSKGGEVEYQPSITADELIACIQNYDALLVRGRTKVTADVMAAGAVPAREAAAQSAATYPVR